MSKNTGASKFRKVNVDEYDEENFQDNEDTDVGEVGPNENEVVNYLNQSKNVEALKAVLQNPLQGCKDKRMKDKVVQLVVRVLTAFKTSEIEKGVNALDSKSLDILMKYIYRGFEFPSEGSSAALLTWHEKVYAVGGSGTIIRVLTDRRNV
ncbi:actin-related protein 2/3 complex subunit 5-C-like [Saccostrea echinata]|uniref:actin-related protein 2/3 complex subunit 5-C-like n=1 Tax=Saccostrea echinata TaxID=191078 RepID=UPI002A7FE086|nr:actin-related protein 2/3 complex subunit 5-C-like [Saccostrea echinata]